MPILWVSRVMNDLPRSSHSMKKLSSFKRTGIAGSRRLGNPQGCSAALRQRMRESRTDATRFAQSLPSELFSSALRDWPTATFVKSASRESFQNLFLTRLNRTWPTQPNLPATYVQFPIQFNDFVEAMYKIGWLVFGRLHFAHIIAAKIESLSAEYVLCFCVTWASLSE